MPKKSNTSKGEYEPEEAERRATEGLRTALMTPYTPQRNLVGKANRSPVKKKNPQIKRSQEAP